MEKKRILRKSSLVSARRKEKRDEEMNQRKCHFKALQSFSYVFDKSKMVSILLVYRLIDVITINILAHAYSN